MKTTILIKENRTQLVLHPESRRDKEVLDILEELPNTHRFDLYDRQGGFTMIAERTDVREGKDLMIVFDRPKEEPNVQ